MVKHQFYLFDVPKQKIPVVYNKWQEAFQICGECYEEARR